MEFLDEKLNSEFYKSYEKRFGNLIDIFIGEEYQNFETMLWYLKDNGIKPKKIYVSTFDLDVVKSDLLLNNIFKDIDSVKIIGYSKNMLKEKIENIEYITKENQESEQLAVIFTENNDFFVWFEPYNYIASGIRCFGFDVVENKNIAKRFRPRLYKSSKQQANEIINFLLKLKC